MKDGLLQFVRASRALMGIDCEIDAAPGGGVVGMMDYLFGISRYASRRCLGR